VTDIAPLAVFLASDESAWITGEVIRAAGGLSCGDVNIIEADAPRSAAVISSRRDHGRPFV
jgi:hypothetical protein